LPDLTTHTATACVTQREWSTQVPSSTGASHTVSWGRLYAPTRTTEYGYTCTCLGFAMRKKCKHVSQVEERDRSDGKGPDDRCGWDNRWEGGSPDEDGDCPCCGANTYTYSYGA